MRVALQQNASPEMNLVVDVPALLLNFAYAVRFEIAFVVGITILWASGFLSVRSARESKALRKVHQQQQTVSATRRGRGAHGSVGLGAASLQSGATHVPPGGTAERTVAPPALGGRGRDGGGTNWSQDVAALAKGTVDRARLQDAGWLIPRLAQLSVSQAQRGIEVYRAALDAGLDLSLMKVASERDKLLSPLLTSAIRAGLADQAIWVLKDLRRRNLEVSSGLYTSVVKLCTSKQFFKECLAISDLLPEDQLASTVDRSVWSCLLFCAVEMRAYQRCKPLFEQLKAKGPPSQKDYWNMVRHASAHADWKLMVQLVQEMREQSIEIDSVIYNTTLAACVNADQVTVARKLLDEMDSVGGVADVITYNTLMKGYAKGGNMEECQAVYSLMCQRGLSPSQVTYGILLDGWINSNRVDEAANVFEIMTREGCLMNTVLYTTLIKGFARDGKVDDAMRIYGKMNGEGSVPPDLITFSILLKANCDEGRLHVGLELLEAMLKLGLQPDEVIFNNLLAGCAKQSNVELAKRLYSDMTATGIRPSNATFSILIRLYAQCKLLDEAVELLQTESKKHKVELEGRIFSQLIQCCIRARQGRRAVEVYEAMFQHSTPAAVMHSSMLGMCVKLNMFDTAVELLQAAAARGARVDARDAQLVFEGARRKKKFSSAEACAVAMRTLGLTALEPAAS